MINTNEEMLSTMNSHSMEQTWFSPRLQSATSNRDDVDYKLEENRIQSFVDQWSHNASLSPLELSAAGLYFTGPGDRVQCAWCKGGLYNWEAGDIAISEHKKHFPKCLFIQRKIDEMTGICRKPESLENGTQRKNSYEISPAVKIVGQMGYDEETIAKGVQKVLTDWCKDLTASKLLDAIYEIEAAEEEENCQETATGLQGTENNYGETDKLCDGIVNGLYIESGGCRSTPNINGQDSATSEYGIDIPQNDELAEIGNRQNDRFCTAQSELGHTSSYTECDDELHVQAPCNCLDLEKQNNTTTLRLVDDSNQMQSQSTMNTKLVTLLEENKKLKHSKTCKICLENEVNVLFLPCRHLVCCELCGDSVKMCPLCRTVIVATVKTFLA